MIESVLRRAGDGTCRAEGRHGRAERGGAAERRTGRAEGRAGRAGCATVRSRAACATVRRGAQPGGKRPAAEEHIRRAERRTAAGKARRPRGRRVGRGEGRARRAERRTADGIALCGAQQTAPLVWGAVAALPAGLPSVHQIILGTGQARHDGASRGSAARGCPAAVPGQLVRATFLCRILADGNP